MRLRRIAFLVLITISVSAFGHAQKQEWIPRGIESLGQNASSRTEFTLDHSMLVLASKLDQDDEDLRRVIAGVDGVSVHSYRFPKPGMYDSDALNSVRQQFHVAGWKHMVSTHDKDGGSGATDLWIHFENKAIRNIAVLFAGEKQLNLIAVSGSISPLDLLHLGGHFGIPKIEGGTVVPVPDSDR
jgi:Domain of unknown function (DUF4252)